MRECYLFHFKSSFEDELWKRERTKKQTAFWKPYLKSHFERDHVTCDIVRFLPSILLLLLLFLFDLFLLFKFYSLSLWHSPIFFLKKKRKKTINAELNWKLSIFSVNNEIWPHFCSDAKIFFVLFEQANYDNIFAWLPSTNLK